MISTNFVFILGFCLAIALLQLSAGSADQRSPNPTCLPRPVPRRIQAQQMNVWKYLSKEEAVDVTKWLLARPNLNKTDPNAAREWDNYM